MYISSLCCFIYLAQWVAAAPLLQKRDCPAGTQLVFSQCTAGTTDPGCAQPTYDPRYGYISLSCAPTGPQQLAVPDLNGIVLPDMTNSVPQLPALPELTLPLGD